MLANQQFIDPQVATQIHKLQQQMKKLIQTKINIQNNDKIKQQTKMKLLKYNEDQRVKLRRIIQKCKLSMVEYLDKQVQVISKECVMGGEKVSVENNYNKNNVSLNLQLSQHQHSEKDTNKSVASTSTHCRTNSRHSNNKYQFNQSSRLMNSTNNFNSSSQIMQIAEFNLTSNNLTDKLLNNNRTYNRKILNNQNNSYSFVIQSSPLFYESNRVKDKDKQREKLKLTTYLQNQPQSFIYQNRKQYQQEQRQDNQQQDQQMITQLYTRKIHCLQQKCLYLKQQNSQLQKVIHYQQQTIQQITQMLDQKQQQIKQLQMVLNNNKKINNNNNNRSFYQHQYQQRANQYQQRANQYQQRANQYQQRANQYQQRANQYQQRAKQLQTVIGYVFCELKSKLRDHQKFSQKRLLKQLQELQTSCKNKNSLFQQIINKHNNNKEGKISPSSSAFSKINHKQSHQTVIISHLPQLTPPMHQLNNNNNPQIPSYQSSKLHYYQQQSMLSSSSIYNQNHLQQQQSSTQTKNELDILTLTNKLLQLQQTLKSIKLQNQQLRAERSLLLKRIKIT